LVAHGARLVICSRSQENVDAALSELGPNACGLTGDASEPETATRAVALAVSAFGQLDALYHVAGGSGRAWGDGPLHEMTDEGLRHTLDLNLASIMLSNRAAVRQFLAQGRGGAILNMGSVLGWSPSPEFFASHAYAAAKAGIVGFSRAIASYYAPQNIRVNVIAPALVETPMSRRAVGNEAIMNFIAKKQPLDGGRVGVPEDCDGAALFLLSRASRFVTGQVIAVDGGWTVSEGRG
jgi:NAD(P)-dependent dehydrogenase (short-subunit alcohol dehydrogenase family)